MTGISLAALAALLAALLVAAISYRKLAVERQRCLNSFARLDVLLKRLCERLDPGPPPEAPHPPGPTDATALKARSDFQQSLLAAASVLLGTEGAHPSGRALAGLARAFAQLDRSAARLPAPEGAAAAALTDARARVAQAKATFNGSAASYNRARRAFPWVLFTRLFGFRKAYPYPMPEEEEGREVRL
ncbi:MAG: hypothetical protein LBR80_16425 [Deltaproteobacteria bacterium]|jgi:hypothetical protein|nr:hypothetical protein [Deltaproteobacteria bacterium]